MSDRARDSRASDRVSAAQGTRLVTPLPEDLVVDENNGTEFEDADDVSDITPVDADYEELLAAAVPKSPPTSWQPQPGHDVSAPEVADARQAAHRA